MATNTTVKKKLRGVTIQKPQDVTRLLTRLINQVIRAEKTVEELRGISYAAQVILKCFEVGNLEERLIELESKLKH